MGLKRFKQFTWLFTFLFLAYGFQPFKFPQFSFDEKTEIIIEKQACTCSPDYRIDKGILKIPSKFKEHFKDKVFEVSLEKNHILNKYPYEICSGHNQFIVSAEIIGIDSTDVYCSKVPIIKLKKWRPTQYRPHFFTFKVKWIIIYFLTGIGLIILSIILLFIRTKKQNKTL